MRNLFYVVQTPEHFSDWSFTVEVMKFHCSRKKSKLHHLIITILGFSVCQTNAAYSSVRNGDVIYGKGNSLIYYDASKGTRHKLFVSKGTISSIDYIKLPDGYFVVWYDSYNNAIYSGQLNDKTLINVRAIIKDNVGHVETIAVDWVAQRLYWTVTDVGQIQVAHLDGSSRAIILDGLLQPTALALDPISGWMFWCELNNGLPLIKKSTMAGEQQSVLFQLSTNKCVSSFAIDHSSQKLYWVDERSNSFPSISYDGSNYEEGFKVHSSLKHPISFIVSNGDIRLTDAHEQININVSGIVMLHSSKRPEGKTPCSVNNGGCSDLCLINGLGFKCHCPISMRLLPDNKTCQEIISDCPKNVSSCSGKSYNNQGNQIEYQSLDLENSHSKTEPSTMKSPSNRKELIGPQVNTSKTKEERSCNLTCLNNGKCVFTPTGDQLCNCPFLYSGERCEFPQSSKVAENINLLANNLLALTITVAVLSVVITIALICWSCKRCRRSKQETSEANQRTESSSPPDSPLLPPYNNNNTSFKNEV